MFFCIEKKELHFKQPAGTSRGVYMTRKIWLVTLSDGEHQGVGECAPLPDLSCDALPDETYRYNMEEVQIKSRVVGLDISNESGGSSASGGAPVWDGHTSAPVQRSVAPDILCHKQQMFSSWRKGKHFLCNPQRFHLISSNYIFFCDS